MKKKKMNEGATKSGASNGTHKSNSKNPQTKLIRPAAPPPPKLKPNK